MKVPVREIAEGVFCLGPKGRTQTNVYLVHSADSWVLIDAGWANDAVDIRSAATATFGRGTRPTAILLTHDHPDHAGSARALAETWACPVYVHPGELPIALGDFAAMQTDAGPLDRWVVLPVMRAIGKRRRDAALAASSLKDVVRALEPGGIVPGAPGWTAIPTPGHTRGHISYFRAADRVLITGDALVTLRVNSPAGLLGRAGLSGPPWYTTWDPPRARASVAVLAGLDAEVLGPGHGQPLCGPGTAAAVRGFVTGVG